MITELLLIGAALGSGYLGFRLALREVGSVPHLSARAGRDIGVQAGRDVHQHVTDHQRMLDYFCQAKDLQRTVDLLSEHLMAKEMTCQEYLGIIKDLKEDVRNLKAERRRYRELLGKRPGKEAA
jgi:hypothetical protein